VTLSGQSEPLEIPAENLRPGDELEIMPDVFWTVLEVEESHDVFVQLVHDRRYTYGAGDRVRILRSES